MKLGAIIFWSCIVLALGVMAMEAKGQTIGDDPCSVTDSEDYPNWVGRCNGLHTAAGLEPKEQTGGGGVVACMEGFIVVEGGIKFRCGNGQWKEIENPWAGESKFGTFVIGGYMPWLDFSQPPSVYAVPDAEERTLERAEEQSCDGGVMHCKGNINKEVGEDQKLCPVFAPDGSLANAPCPDSLSNEEIERLRVLLEYVTCKPHDISWNGKAFCINFNKVQP